MYYRKRHDEKIYCSVETETQAELMERVMLDEIGQVGVRLSDEEAVRVRERFVKEVQNVE
jgi:hypothetical protein